MPPLSALDPSPVATATGAAHGARRRSCELRADAFCLAPPADPGGDATPFATQTVRASQESIA